jgi:hypothetical protein
MKGRATWSRRIMFVLLALFIAKADLAHAQQTSNPSGKNSRSADSEVRAGDDFDNSFASSEFAFDGRVIVQGAPFSAVGIKETTQILSDGRRIERRKTMKIYRDSRGRTRHEPGGDIKPEAAGVVPLIYDAVTGGIHLLYMLDRRVAQLSPPVKGGPARGVKIITPQGPPDNITQEAPGEIIEPLGTKVIEGVATEGVRVTTTIPLPEIGARQSQKAISERWYSQELRRNILIKSIDPRFGEAVYRLTNINRSEPPGDLFIIPAEYKPASSAKQTRAATLVSVKLERGGHVAVDNRTTGRIRVIGWDKDTVEATATSERGVEAVRFTVTDSPEKVVWLKADYLKREGDEKPRSDAASGMSPTPTVPVEIPPLPPNLPKQIHMPGSANYEGPEDPPMRDGRPIEVHLEVRVPRYAEIDLIKVIRSPVEVTGVNTSVVVMGDKSDVVIRGVREAEVRTRSGAIAIEDVGELVEVITASGAVRVRDVKGNVRVLSISGNVEVECVRGRVNVDTANGSIALSNVQGDVEANASNSDIHFAGPIREDGRYHLKTMSGVVEMALRDKPPGFTAALSSYRGTIENDFQLQVKHSREQEDGEVNRRIVGRHGNGQAQITLDSFDGRVKLAKLTPDAVKECKTKEP